MGANTPLSELDDAARADITAHGLDALRAFIDLSQQLATLIVENAKATLNGAGDPTGKPSRKIDHAHDFNLICRAARRGILLREKLLAPPRPEPAEASPRPNPPAGASQNTDRPDRERPDRECIDRIDTLDRIDRLDHLDDDDDPDEALADVATDAASILTISRKYLPPVEHGETAILPPPLPPPLPEPITEAQTLDAQIAEVLQRTRDAVNAYVLATKPPPANATAPPNTS